jgi:predicted ArsR family transcriptional regulator
MQQTRERILEILKVNGQATVDELSQELELTPVTIRHHLEVLRSEGLIAPPQARRRGGPGRPQHIYRLAEEADDFFPKNYHHLAEAFLAELEVRVTPETMEELIEGVAERMASQANLPEGSDFSARLAAVVDFLNTVGHLASVETRKNGDLLLHIANCPYERVARRHPQPCKIDARMIARLLGVAVERLERITDGHDRCTYLIPANAPS